MDPLSGGWENSIKKNLKKKTKKKREGQKITGKKKDIEGTILPFAACISCITVHRCSLLLKRRANSTSLFLIAVHRSPK